MESLSCKVCGAPLKADAVDRRLAIVTCHHCGSIFDLTKAGAKAADWATTSQEEADRNRGREMRKAEERERKACKKEGREDC